MSGGPGRIECSFCGESYATGVRACPKCAYPADGRFETHRRGAPPPPPGGRARRPRRPSATAQPEAATTWPCPQCGAPVAAGAAACRECGSDARTGWKSDDVLDMAGATIPEFDEDDYERVVREAHPGHVRFWGSRQIRIAVIGVILVLAMLVPILIAIRHLP